MSAQRILHDNGVINVLSNNNYEYQFFIKDHLGNTRVVCKPDFETGGTLKSSPVVLQRSDYYPFGMIHGGVDNNQPLGVNENRYLYNGKEYQSRHWAEWTEEDDPTYFAALDWYDYGARFYDASLGRFHTQDAFAEKYVSMSPYQYGANNPINVIDINGDSIWYTINDNVITMHVTGKVMNQSDDDIDMGETISDLTEDLTNAFSGEVEINGETYELQTDIKLEEATSMDDVEKSDHLVVLANGKDEPGNARGATSMQGGKVIHLYSGDYPTNAWYSPGWSNTRTAVHEFGHAADLTHTYKRRNLMVQSGSGTDVTSDQREYMIRRRNNINRGPNSVTNPYTGKTYPYPYIHYYNKKRGRYEKTHVNNVGLSTK